MTVYEKGLITIIACSFLFAAIAIPLMLRKVPRNVLYGFRTRTTLSSDAIWYDANAHFGRGLLVASIVSVIAICVLYTLDVPPRMFLNLSIVALIVPSAFATLATARYIRSLTARLGNRGH